jgi:hypothetical protein
VLNLDKNTKGGKNIPRHWICKCDCGNVVIKRGDNLKGGGTNSCGCLPRKKKDQNWRWKGYKEISGDFFTHIKNSAKSRNIPFHITVKQIWWLFLKQNRRCALTGLKLNFQSCYVKRDGTASLDRIDSNKEYNIKNVQWIHKDLNRMKSDFSTEKFLEYCKLVCKKLS